MRMFGLMSTLAHIGDHVSTKLTVTGTTATSSTASKFEFLDASCPSLRGDRGEVRKGEKSWKLKIFFKVGVRSKGVWV